MVFRVFGELKSVPWIGHNISNKKLKMKRNWWQSINLLKNTYLIEIRFCVTWSSKGTVECNNVYVLRLIISLLQDRLWKFQLILNPIFYEVKGEI